MADGMSCYKVTLPTRHSGSAVSNGKSVKAEDGIVYVIAEDAAHVGEEFPDALIIRRIGVGVPRILGGTCGDAVEVLNRFVEDGSGHITQGPDGKISWRESRA